MSRYAELVKDPDILWWADEAVAVLGMTEPLKIHWNHRIYSKAGWACPATRQIALSSKLWPLMDDDQRRYVVRHEVAHIAAGARAAHGLLWKCAMRKLGENPARKVRIPGAAVFRRSYGEAICACAVNPVHRLTRHQAEIARGERPGRVYCMHCRQTLTIKPE